MLNKVMFVVKKIILGFLFIYAYNTILFSLDLNIPINIFTIFLVTILGMPALIGLSLFSLFIF